MSLISVLSVTLQTGSKVLFKNLNLSIQAGDKIGLVGHNGCGKSTFLRLLMQQLEPDTGRVHQQNGIRIGSVEQFVPEQMLVQPVLHSVIECLPEELRTTHGFQAERLLHSLGLAEPLWQKTAAELSGGQQNLVLMARALVNEPDLLLLDEPGNHMDQQAMTRLKTFLASEQAPAFIMVSHDRDLLDAATNRTVWLRDQRAYAFAMPYSAAKQALEQMDAEALQRRTIEEKEAEALRRSAKRIKNWGVTYDNPKLIRKAKSMEKRVERMEEAYTFVSAGTGLQLQVDAELLSSKQIFAIENTNIETPDQRLLFKVNELVMRPGDRIALLGDNGCGKSTFIQHLLHTYGLASGEQQQTRFNPNVRIGYFDQHLVQFEQPISMLDWCREYCQASEERIRKALIDWGFPYLDHSRRVTVLSGGERARLQLLAFQLDQPNCLVMDEPTNHIDLQGKESLEADLVSSNITLLFTSHDRRFVEQVATRFWLIHDGIIEEIHDSTKYYNAQLFGESTAVAATKLQHDSPDRVETLSTEESLLERLVELEQLLSDDLARKKKFQKPEKQALWQQEMASLQEQLGV